MGRISSLGPLTWLILAAAMLMLPGCAFQNVRTQQSKMEMLCKIPGSVSTEHEMTSPMLVGLVRPAGGPVDNRHNWNLVDHFAFETSGRWMFGASLGTYGLVAFKDSSADDVYQSTAPFLPLDNDSAAAKVAEQKEEKIKRFLQAAGKDEPAKKL